MAIDLRITELVDCIRAEFSLADDQATHLAEAIQARFAGRRIYFPAKPGTRRRDETIRTIALRIISEGHGVTAAAEKIVALWIGSDAPPAGAEEDIFALQQHKPVSSRTVLRVVSETQPRQDEAVVTLDSIFCRWH
jgi:hypothetical protein